MRFFLWLFFLLPAAVWADTGGDGGEVSDLSIDVLKALFAGSPNFGAGEDAFQSVLMPIGALSSGFVMLFILWHVLTRLLRGASVGQMFNGTDRVYSPLRVLFAAIMPLPVFNGYGLIHVIILYGATVLYSAASAVWFSAAGSDLFVRTLAVSPIQPDSKRLAKNVLMMSMCMRAYEYQAIRDGRKLTMGWSTGFGESKGIFWGSPATSPQQLDGASNSLVEMVRSDKSRDVVLMAGDPMNAGEIKHNSCGSITIKSFYEAKKGTAAVLGQATADAIAGGALAKKIGEDMTEEGTGARWLVWAGGMASVVDALITGVYDAQERKQWAEQSAYGHALALEELMLNADKISHAIYARAENADARTNLQLEAALTAEGKNTVSAAQLGLNTQLRQETMSRDQIIAEIDALAAKYQATLRKQVGLSQDGGERIAKLVEDSGKHGWLTAGLVFSQMASLSDSMNKMAMEMPEATAKTTSDETQLNKKFNSRYLSKVNEYLHESQVYRDDGETIAIADKDLRDTDTGAARQSRTKGLFGGIGNAASDFAMKFAVEPDAHPLVQLQKWGRLSLMGSAYLFAADTSTMVASQNADPNERTATSVAMRMFSWFLASIMFFMGLLLAYLVPLLPSIYWLGIVLSCYILLIQNMVAAAIWSGLHALPHQGDDFAGAQRAGWGKFLLDLLKPLFAVAGFIILFTVLTVFGTLFSMLFMFLYSSNNVTDGVGLILGFVNAFVMPFVYLIMTYTLFIISMRLLHSIGDTLNEAIGIGGGRVGDMVESFGGNWKNAFGQFASQTREPMTAVRNDLAELARMNGNRSARSDSSAPVQYDNDMPTPLESGADTMPVTTTVPMSSAPPTKTEQAGNNTPSAPPTVVANSDSGSAAVAAPPTSSKPIYAAPPSVGGVGGETVQAPTPVSSPSAPISSTPVVSSVLSTPVSDDIYSDLTAYPELSPANGRWIETGGYSPLTHNPNREYMAHSTWNQEAFFGASYNMGDTSYMTYGNRIGESLTATLYAQSGYNPDVGDNGQVDYTSLATNTDRVNAAIGRVGGYEQVMRQTRQLDERSGNGLEHSLQEVLNVEYVPPQQNSAITQ